MKTLYLECNMGAAGDMLMAALYELLPDQKGFLEAMNGLGLPGVRVEPKAAKTCGIAGTHMEVTVHGEEEDEHHHHDHDHDHDHDHEHCHDHEHEHCHDHEHHHEHEHEHGHEHEPHHEHDHHHATPGHIGEIIAALPLPEEVRHNAKAVYDSIAAAEARAHGCEMGDVHFHEVGALDAVADVVGVCYAIYLLKPDQIAASPVHVGCGQVRCAHGVVPVPAPATAALLEGIPAYGGEVRGELCTPTGAALLRRFSTGFGPMPVMAVSKTGYGLGKKEFERANCVRAFWGETEPRLSAAAPSGAQDADGNGEIAELVCNIDDMTAEALSFAAQRLLDAGALDVYTTPGTMKKGRAGVVLTVLCDVAREGELARAVLRETTTNGLRVRRCAKYFLTPRSERVDTPYGPIRVKCAEGWGISHRKPEYDDVSAAARKADVPFSTVWECVIAKLQKQ